MSICARCSNTNHGYSTRTSRTIGAFQLQGAVNFQITNRFAVEKQYILRFGTRELTIVGAEEQVMKLFRALVPYAYEPGTFEQNVRNLAPQYDLKIPRENGYAR